MSKTRIKYFLTSVALVIATTLFGATYTSTQNGDYFDDATWVGGNAPPTTIGNGDEVIINHTLTFTDDVKSSGTANFTINAGASLTGDDKLEFDGSGTITVHGTLSNTDDEEMKFKGTTSLVISSTGTIVADKKLKMEGSSSINNSGTINADKIEIKGNGTATLGGTIQVEEEFKAKDDAVVSITGTLVTNNKFKIENDGDVTIDASASVEVGGLLEIKGDAAFVNNGDLVADDVEVKDDVNVTFGGEVRITNDIKFEDDVTVTISGSMHVDDDFELNDNSDITISSGATVVVEDHLDLKDGGTELTVNGTFVGENGEENNGTINGSGVFQMDGGFDNNGTMNGTLNICSQDGTSNPVSGTAAAGSTSDCDNAGSTFPVNPPDALPVTFHSFNGELNGDNVELEWVTGVEINNDYFELQYSSSREFESISKIKGNGTTNWLTHYSYTHQSPKNGFNYYRLKQVDFDGKSDYSKIISVYFGDDKSKSEINHLIYPNPSDNQVTVVHNKSHLSLVQVFDLFGKSINNYSITNRKEDQLTLDISKLETGMYIIVLDGISSTFIKK